MYLWMNDTLALLQDRVAKAEAKALRAEKAWETAKNELNDLQTTLRVMNELAGESDGSPPSSPSAVVAERQLVIVKLLRVGEGQGSSPAEVYEAYKLLAEEDISIDTFRTTIWRMRDGGFRDGEDMWVVKGENGKYWKSPATMGTHRRYIATQNQPAPAPRPAPKFDDDENEPPF